nr:hypothetical protein [Tanacetum cinerariifolium]
IVRANLNPENLNVPNEGVLEEDPHHLLDYDKEEDPEMEIEEEEPEEEPVDDDDDVEVEEDDESDDVDIEEDDDAEIIFPYEAEGADVELEAEEPDGVPEATIGTGSQRPFTVRDFPMGFYEAGEFLLLVTHSLRVSTARDPQFVGGLAAWALRRDLETLRRHERIREAESETSRTEVALLGSEAKITKIERC